MLFFDIFFHWPHIIRYDILSIVHKEERINYEKEQELRRLFEGFLNCITKDDHNRFLDKLTLDDKIILIGKINEYKKAIYIYLFLKSNNKVIDKDIFNNLDELALKSANNSNNEQLIVFNEKYQLCIDTLNISISKDIDKENEIKKLKKQ